MSKIYKKIDLNKYETQLNSASGNQNTVPSLNVATSNGDANPLDASNHTAVPVSPPYRDLPQKMESDNFTKGRNIEATKEKNG